MQTSRINRTYAVAAFDVTMAALSFAVALLLRRGVDNFWHESSGFFVEGIVAFSVISAIVFWRMRIYRGFWRYTSSRDVTKIAWAAAIAILIFVALLFVVTRLEAYPRSALPINLLFLVALLAGPRILYRSLMERRLTGFFQRANGERRVPVLLLGLGEDADLFIRSSLSGGAANYRVVGLVDDDTATIGRHIHGVRVYGPARNLVEIVRALKHRGTQPRRLILTSDSFDSERLREILDAAQGLSMPFSRLPRMTDFRNGEGDVIDIRPVAIEDLLGRPQAALDSKEMAALIQGRRVCVTGAGGSIGSELCRQIAGHGPAHMTLIDNSEFNLYTVDMELAENHADISRKAVLGDVRDSGRLNSTFAETRPQLVFHAAALKHVHMVEANPNEGVLTNVLGTRNVADACVAHSVAVMVLISSDKAVNPTNVMGATKRIAESYCQTLGLSLAAGEQGHTRLVTVRFGNVLASSGSVVPLFQRQIAAGGPVTVTDPEVTRYFMTTREAVQLVLQASGLSARGKGGEIFVLDMGTPIRIRDLASQMIRLAGLTPERDIAIEYTGLRPGEKLTEELFHAKEPLSETSVSGLQRAMSRPADLALLQAQIDRLCAAAAARDSEATLAEIAVIVPEFRGQTPNPDTPVTRRAAQ
ncbi:MAG: nucleoside-diphosphate sugar epimerase/dehydratase [Proteobacteria bacterium]|nr:nucleoside-diphosphate sugar epimerase/dehydratase [Pseudomonadota bacterium]MDA1357768.1 nucleoside-diphosphate sugar epimerase/dehydratase [Pseudomonadota bacterium]